MLQNNPNPDDAAPFLGNYHNDVLGDVTFSNQNGKLMLQAGGYSNEVDETVQKGTYLTTDGILSGVPFVFTQDASGNPQVVVAVPPDMYKFTRNP